MEYMKVFLSLVGFNYYFCFFEDRENANVLDEKRILGREYHCVEGVENKCGGNEKGQVSFVFTPSFEEYNGRYSD
ncbi:hypothetical protein [Xenorhabdus hominickii]|nr:hypothetical protein [Xenorhabdus hominickii]